MPSHGTWKMICLYHCLLVTFLSKVFDGKTLETLRSYWTLIGLHKILHKRIPFTSIDCIRFLNLDVCNGLLLVFMAVFLQLVSAWIHPLLFVGLCLSLLQVFGIVWLEGVLNIHKERTRRKLLRIGSRVQWTAPGEMVSELPGNASW